MSAFHALFSLGGMSGAAIGGAIAARGVAIPLHFGAIAGLLAAVALVMLPSLLDGAGPAAR